MAKKKNVRNTVKKAGGRPTDYKTTYNKQVEKLCKLGATDEEIAEFFEVDEATINRWKKKYPKFCESIKKGKMLADAEVAEKLYHRAIGYEHKDTKFATHEGKITDREEYIKHYAPDPTAAIFWLKNRQKSKWRDKQEVESINENHNANLNMNVEYSDNELNAYEKWQKLLNK